MNDKVINHLVAPPSEQTPAQLHNSVDKMAHFDFITLDMAPIVRKVANRTAIESYVMAARKKYI